jgi:hypothetical protein
VDRRESGRQLASPPGRALTATSLIFFKYVGPTAMTVVGPVTGRRYVLPGPGATAAVDPRDAPAVAAVPHLVRVAHP